MTARLVTGKGGYVWLIISSVDVPVPQITCVDPREALRLGLGMKS